MWINGIHNVELLGGFEDNALEEWANQGARPLYRKQFVENFPWLAYVFASNQPAESGLDVTNIVDQGVPLIDSISMLIGIKPHNLRHLAHVSPLQVGEIWSRSPIQMLRAMDLLPPEKLPQSSAEWQILSGLWNTCFSGMAEMYERPLSLINHRDPIAEYLFAGVCSRGVAVAAKVTSKDTPNDMERLEVAFQYIEFVREWCATGSETASDSEVFDIVSRHVTEGFIKRYSATEILCQAERWQDEMSTLSTRKRALESDPLMASWPALPVSPYPIGERRIRPLTTPAELIEEGHRLQHCVGDFAHTCLLGRSHIVSIRDLDDQPLSTAEIGIHEKDGYLFPIVVQHQALRNESPTDKCKIALNDWVKTSQFSDGQDVLRRIQAFHQNDTRRNKLLDLFEQIEQADYQDMQIIMQSVLKDYEAASRWLANEYLYLASRYYAHNARRHHILEMYGLEEENDPMYFWQSLINHRLEPDLFSEWDFPKARFVT